MSRQDIQATQKHMSSSRETTGDLVWITDIKRYVLGCEQCQINKADHQRKQNPLHPNEVPQNPWDIINLGLYQPQRNMME